MTHTYNITGMTCNGCVAKAKSELLKLSDVTVADVQLQSPQATITMQKHINILQLQSALNKAGNYIITEDNSMPHLIVSSEEKTSWLATYKPILLIGSYITAISLLTEAVKPQFDVESWMRHFMAAFFLTFSFFKLLDVKGFAESYSTYDIIAKKWLGWGYVYAFAELTLGIAYLLQLNSLLTNAVTFVLMSISIIGVLETVINKRKIRCACLGAVFNLPMSTITIIEDGLMILMSLVMLLQMI